MPNLVVCLADLIQKGSNSSGPNKESHRSNISMVSTKK